MKPYEIEIFDRHFNFIYNALIDESDFSYSYDAISPVKNTLPITKDFNPLVLSEESSAPKGWYIRVLRDNEEYCGVITAFESGETINTITLSPMTEIFNLSIPLPFQSGANVVMETFIKNTIEENFQSSADSQQNIENLTCVTTSSPTGTFPFSTKSNSSGFVSVNVAKDIISEAVAAGIITTVNMDIANKGINVIIGIKDSIKNIEGDLPNIANKTFNIRKGNNAINRYSAYDTYFTTGYEYYLHSDGSYDSQDRDRILPIVNKIDFYDSYDVSMAEIDEQIDSNNIEIQRLLAYNGTLSNTDYAKLQSVDFGTVPVQNGFDYRLKDYVSRWGLNYRTIFNAAQNESSYSIDNASYNDIELMYQFYYLINQMPGYGWFKFSVEFSNFHLATNAGVVQKIYDSTPILEPGEAWETSEPISSGIAYSREALQASPQFVPKSHLYMNEEYVFNAHIYIGYYGSEEGMQHTIVAESISNREEHLYVRTPMYWSDVSSYINSYKGTPAYYEEVKANAQAASLREATLLAQTAFATNKYSNLIELTVKADDERITPLDMEIGQVVNIIHNGVSYNSILTGKEIHDGIVKLIFGTIRLELTKILNMKGV